MSISKFNISQKLGMQMTRNRRVGNILTFGNPFHIKHYRKKILIGTYDIFNGITNEGKNKLLDTMFNGSSQIANNSWFVGQISAASYSAVADTDTMASHSGWLEFTNYTQATRVAWGSGAAAAQEVTNASPLTFTFSADGTLKGVFVATNSTKGGTTGILWATALYNADVPVQTDDELKITYSVSC